jgi:hypothetical protein
VTLNLPIMTEEKIPEERSQIENERRLSSAEEKFDGDNSDRNVEDLSVGKVRSDSSSTVGTTDSIDHDQRPTLAQMASRNSVPASVMSHPVGGADLEKGPTGLKNRTVDEEGRIVVNWTSRTDPDNPKNWSKKKKVFNVVVISLMTFLCPLCSAMFVCHLLPSLN